MSIQKVLVDRRLVKCDMISEFWEVTARDF